MRIVSVYLSLFSYASIAFPTALTTSTYLLFFSSISFLDSLSIGEMNNSQIKEKIIWVRSTRELGNLIAIIKFYIIEGNVKKKIK